MVSHQLQGLRPIRRFRRFQRHELASAIGVTPSSYTRFERGERRIYWDKVTILANRLGVRTDDLNKALTEDDARRLCDERDKAAIAAGTFRPDLWDAQASTSQAPPPPDQAQVPPPPAANVPPPPPLNDADAAAAELADWNEES